MRIVYIRKQKIKGYELKVKQRKRTITNCCYTKRK